MRDFTFERDLVTRVEDERLSVAGRYGVMAAVEALSEAALQRGGAAAPDRIATCLGVGMLSPDFSWYDRVYMHQRFGDESLRAHIRFFVNGEQIHDLSQPLCASDELIIVQALSGG